ncbi:MAG: dehydrogenase [Myxococcales bacterium]
MDAIRFHLNDRLVEEREAPPTTTLLRYLRDHLGLTATKEGCAEGDCGACTVAVLDPLAHGGPTYRAVNACLLLLPMVHGRRVYTAEGIGAGGGMPHPAQESIVQELGSQCGYCTPGVVMSLFEATYRADMDAPWKLDDQMCGNLCRCTGYRPIRDAARRVAGSCPDDRFRALLAEDGGGATLSYEGAGQRYDAPGNVQEIVGLLDGTERVICGATDLGLDVTKRHAKFPRLVSLEAAPELRAIRHDAGLWTFGAAAPLADVEAATAADLPSLARMLRFFGSRQIKNRATLGGNLCNASPIGDTAPILLALGARVVLRSRGGERRVPLDDFFVGYRRTALEAGELLVAVEVPDPPAGARIGAYKVSKRRELDISAVAAGMYVRVEGGTVSEARLAYGGMAATPARAHAAEAALVGGPWTEAAVEAAVSALDFTPLSDHRGSAWYRATVAANLLRGFFVETRDGERRLPDRPSATVVTEVTP